MPILTILLRLLIHNINSKEDHEATESKLHVNDRCFEKAKKAPILQGVAEKPKIQRRFWHRRSRVIQKKS